VPAQPPEPGRGLRAAIVRCFPVPVCCSTSDKGSLDRPRCSTSQDPYTCSSDR